MSALFVGYRYIKVFVQDKSILYSFAGTVLRILFAPIALFLVANNLSPKLQGFYYLFFSIAGMQQIIEAGFSHTIIQSISHEMQEVKFVNHVLIGKKENLCRINEAMKMGFSWFMLVCFFCIFIIYPSGLFIIGKDHWQSYDIWLIPWTVFMFIFSLNILLYPVNFFFEGILKLDLIYKNRLFIQIIGPIFFILALYSGMGLYSIVCFSLTSLMVNFFVLFLPNIKQFKEYVFKLPNKRYIRETIKWQLKVSSVWCTGYFYWNLPTVLLFTWLGPIISGQYSMTISMINSIKNVGLVFVSTKVSIIGSMRSNGKFDEAYKIYLRGSIFAYIVFLGGGFALFILWIMFPNFLVWKRVMPLNQSLILFFTQVLGMVTLNQAMFARCCKDEPFFLLSMFTNLSFPIALFVTIQLLPNIWSIILTFCIIHLIQFLWGCVKFKSLYNHGWM